MFLQFRKVNEVSPGNVRFYEVRLGRFLRQLDPDRAQQQDIERFLLQFKKPGNRHAYFRALRTFYIWREQAFDAPTPMKHIKAPRLGKLMMPILSPEQVHTLLKAAHGQRGRAIIALFVESGLRLSELTNITAHGVDWNGRVIRVIGKGRKEAPGPFGDLSETHLKAWLSQTQPSDSNIWGANQWGIESMRRLLGMVVCRVIVWHRVVSARIDPCLQEALLKLE